MRVDVAGDLGGLSDLERSIEIAERLNAVETMIRGYKNLASMFAELGDLARAADLEWRGADVSRRAGTEYQIMWFETELGVLAYRAGEWDAADAAFTRLDDWMTRNGPHYMEAAAAQCRAKLRAARGDVRGAQADLDRALDFGRRSGDAQVLLPVLGTAATIAATFGKADAPGRVAELFAEIATATGAGGYWATEIALAVALTGQVGLLAEVALEGPSRWVAAAILIAGERYAEAAEELGGIGARPEEALAWLLAAGSSIARGERARADVQLDRATRFWNEVGANGQAAAATAMLTRTA